MKLMATVPWTYWMARPILVVTACALVVFVWIYLKKAVEPRLVHEDQLRALELVGTGGRAAAAQGRTPLTSAAIARARAARRPVTTADDASASPADAGPQCQGTENATRSGQTEVTYQSGT